MSGTLQDKLKRLAGEKPPEGENQTIKKSNHKSKGIAGTPQDRRKMNGGKGNIGRKPIEQKLQERGIKEKLQEFYDGEMMVQITDPKTGQVRIVPKPRVLIAVEKLFSKAVKGDGDIDALSKFLDRVLGRPKQPVTGGDEGDEPIRHEVAGLDDILRKAYGSSDE